MSKNSISNVSPECSIEISKFLSFIGLGYWGFYFNKYQYLQNLLSLLYEDFEPILLDKPRIV